MNGLRERHEMHIDAGCYVVDALDADERVAFEAHLAHCDSCTREVHEFAETVVELARLAAMAPPPQLRQATLSTIRTVRPLPPTVEEFSPATEVVGAVESAAPDDELHRRRMARGRRTRLLAGLAAAAVVVALVLGGLVVGLQQQRQADVAAQSTAQRETDLLSAPDARVLTQTEGDARFSFVVSRQRNAALLITEGLPDPGPTKTYQLWTLQGRRALPDATMPGGVARQWFTGPIRESTSLAVTVEPNGGSAQPTMPILAQVRI